MINWKLVRYIDRFAGIPLAYVISFIGKPFTHSRRLHQNNEHKKILLIKFWGIGNIIMLLPSAHALKEKYPDAELDLLTLFSNKSVAEFAETFDHFYYIDTRNLIRFTIDTLKLISKLRKHNYDIIIDFEQFARFSAIFCSLISRKKTVGFNTSYQHKHFLYTHPVTYNNNIHITRSFYALAECAGTSHKGTIEPVPLTCREKDIEQVNMLLWETKAPPPEILITIHVSTSQNFSLRRWPPEYFAMLADRLIEHFNARVVLMAPPDEVSLTDKTFSYIKNAHMAINTGGKLNFKQFVALIKESDLVISADTAPVHIASCFDVPVAGLYGPNTPTLYGPWGKKGIWFYKDLNCSPCITNYNAKLNKCRHPEGKGTCMKDLSINEIFAGLKRNYFDKGAPFRLEKLSHHE